ncbi:MAG: class II fructose-bisphosphate aldolase [Halanaerobiales bacterium]
MPLVSSLPLLKKAQKKRVAIPAFNIHNLETAQGVIEGAAELRAPVIIATTPGTLRHTGINCIFQIIKSLARKYNIPIALHLDHCSNYDTLVKTIRNGYTSVMIDASELPYKKNVGLVKEVVKVGHAVGIPVEGELGRIGGTEDDMTLDEREATLTVPEEAVDFVDKTGIDFLAVAIGTAHGVYKGEPELDFERLSSIAELVNIPLVLHGASGVPDADVKKAIKSGICKVNIATELKIPFARAVKNYFSRNPEATDPRKYLNSGKEALKKVVKEKIDLCGSREMAIEFMEQ